MKKQKKNDKQSLKNSKGITLIALVISIIVMLILAGVSLNAVVGQNGVLTQAQNATIANKKATILEKLDLELASYNIETITGNPEQTTAMFDNLISKELIDTVLDKDGTYKNTTAEIMGIPNFDDDNNYTGFIDYAVKKDDYQLIISVDDNGIYKSNYGVINIGSGGSVAAGTTLVTSNAFQSGSGVSDPAEKGKFTIDDDASVMFVDEVSGELSILVKSGKHAKVSIFKNMTLTNAGVKRSAIDLETGATLDLYVADGASVTVNSGIGVDATGNTEGKGGYAGIHVPEGATLNLKGSGTITAIGGNGSSGGTPEGGNDSYHSAGGGGAGAGIGGNGGNGGRGKSGQGDSGKIGETCGNVNIYNDITVKAYGGAGGSGGSGSAAIAGGDGSGGAGGGYPSAGIGGGGAGGAGSTCCSAGGGYSGGSEQQVIHTSYNGLGGGNGFGCAGGYFSGIPYSDWPGKILGGLGGRMCAGHKAGDGGQAGSGGEVHVSSNAKVYAFNGNIYTDNATNHQYQNGLNQCPIYAQVGKKVAKYTHTADNAVTLATDEGMVSLSGYINKLYSTDPTYSAKKVLNVNTALGITTNTLLTAVDMSKQGVGSGAGYVEVSNGRYIIEASMN